MSNYHSLILTARLVAVGLKHDITNMTYSIIRGLNNMKHTPLSHDTLKLKQDSV